MTRRPELSVHGAGAAAVTAAGAGRAVMPRASDDPSEAARRLALLTCLAAGFTTLLDQAVVTPAVPSLTTSLHASKEQVQWLLASYSLTFGLALVPAGRLGDLRGRRRLFLAEVGLFGAGSLLSGLTPAVGFAIAARLAQGIGGGMISSQVLGTIQDLFDGHGRARAMGAYGTAGGVAGVAGPLAGGLLVTMLPLDLGWRAVVAMSAPLAAGTLVLGACHLPRRSGSPSRPARLPSPARAAAAVRTDVPGLALLAAATLAGLLPFVRPELPGAGRAGLGAVALAALAGFAWWERRAGTRDPGRVILPPVLARAPGFVAGTLVSTFWFGAQLAQSVVVTLFLLGPLDVPAMLVVAARLPAAAAMALASAVSWCAATRFGTPAISAGLAAEALLLLALAAALPHTSATGALALLFGVNTLSGLVGGLVDSQNRAQTLLHSPDGPRRSHRPRRGRCPQPAG
ncbi:MULTISPECIES: MFS transporter [Protofrankia]|uniref:MFS transporter n=1 Tax=Protofrankia TaxID=2994361 RepID=UPI00069BA11C|nr:MULTISPECIES: MFS transporter [Protofrankia]ONH31029.1 hypothetical protein BL254_23545 [Protofrankia sp. BMG5.30]